MTKNSPTGLKATAPVSFSALTCQNQWLQRGSESGNVQVVSEPRDTVSDQAGGSDTSTLIITVDPVNDAPVAQDDGVVAVVPGTAENIAVLGNDTDVDGNALTVTQIIDPANGDVTETVISTHTEGMLNGLPDQVDIENSGITDKVVHRVNGYKTSSGEIYPKRDASLDEFYVEVTS